MTALWLLIIVQQLSSRMLAIDMGQQTALALCSKRTMWTLKLWLLPTLELEMPCETSFAHVHLPTLGASEYISFLCYRMSTVSLL